MVHPEINNPGMRAKLAEQLRFQHRRKTEVGRDFNIGMIHGLRWGFKYAARVLHVQSQKPYYEVKGFREFDAFAREFYGDDAKEKATALYEVLKASGYDACYLYRWVRQRTDVISFVPGTNGSLVDKVETKKYLERAYAENYPESWTDDSEEDDEGDWFYD